MENDSALPLFPLFPINPTAQRNSVIKSAGLKKIILRPALRRHGNIRRPTSVRYLMSDSRRIDIGEYEAKTNAHPWKCMD